MNPDYIKIPSAMNNHTILLEYLADNYDGQIHISTGMTYIEELDRIKTLFSNKNKLDRLVIYSCTSGYPVEAKEVCFIGNF